MSTTTFDSQQQVSQTSRVQECACGRCYINHTRLQLAGRTYGVASAADVHRLIASSDETVHGPFPLTQVPTLPPNARFHAPPRAVRATTAMLLYLSLNNPSLGHCRLVSVSMLIITRFVNSHLEWHAMSESICNPLLHGPIGYPWLSHAVVEPLE